MAAKTAEQHAREMLNGGRQVTVSLPGRLDETLTNLGRGKPIGEALLYAAALGTLSWAKGKTARKRKPGPKKSAK